MPLQITYVSHASIKLTGNFGTLITDPWILNEPVYAFTTWKFPIAVLEPEEVIADVDYLYISHPHEDHFHIPSLDYFPRDIHIILAEYISNPGLRAQTMERTLRAMGFHNIQKVKPWQTLQLGGNTPFTLIPACSTKYWDWENSGFVLEHDDCTLLNMNDCPSDAELYYQVNQRFGQIDLGFVQYSGVSMYPGCFKLSLDEIKQASNERKVGWLQQRNMIEKLNIKTLFPFAGDFAWYSDEMAHCNWSNRATPQLFSDFVQREYPDQDIDVVIMYPSDTWSPKSGLQRNHPDINWDTYLDAIETVREHFSHKVGALQNWLHASSTEQLQFRTTHFLNVINRWVTQDDIDFSVNVAFSIEGPQSNFVFYATSNTEQFAWCWDFDGSVDHTLHIPESLWAAILDGKILLTNIQWATKSEQHVPFRIEIARFWFWFETHIDLNNRNPQMLIDKTLHPHIEERFRPQHGVFPHKEPSLTHETVLNKK